MAPRTQPERPEFGPVNRVVAALLALIWLLGGVLALYTGFAQHRWIALVVAPLAVAYGAVWARVAQTGRRFPWPARRRGGKSAPRGPAGA